MELHRKILAFPISYHHAIVRIYDHYPVIDGNKTILYLHPIRKFDFTELNGSEKWTTYWFTKSVYNIWMPLHFKRICSIINSLPSDIDIKASRQPEPGEPRLSQGVENYHLSDQSSHDTASILEEVAVN